MASKSSRWKLPALQRSVSASMAGLRAGSALAADGVVQNLRQRTGLAEKNVAGSEFARREARRFVDELGRLKGTYIKIGQMLAMFGEHFLPAVLTEALHELESQTEPLPWSQIEEVLRADLGRKMTQLEIEPVALAAASIGQVHRATITSSGEQICLKIQYPDLAGVIDQDFDAVVRMLRLARWLKGGRELDDWLESMREHLHAEMDYQREAGFCGQMGQLVTALGAAGEVYHVPRVIDAYSGARVLAMEYLEGSLVNTDQVLQLPLARRTRLGQAMLELFFLELFEWGVLQSDPNFGNYLVQVDSRPRAAADRLALLDFGSVLECPQYFLVHLRDTIAFGFAGDRDGIAAALTGLGCLPAEATAEAREMFVDFCLHLLEPLQAPALLPPERLNQAGDYCWQASALLRRAGKQAAKNAASRHFTVPSREFALIARKLSGVFTFIAVLGAEFNGHAVALPYVESWLEQRRGESIGG